HRGSDLLTTAGAVTLIKRRHNAEREVETRAAIADLRAGDERQAVAEASGRGRAAGALRDVLVDLAVLVGAGAEAFDRSDDHAWGGLVDVVPRQSHAIERAGGKIFNQHVAVLDQPLEDFLALGMLAVDRD